jgi:RimJ/RimL family protein N-acetyltransferase
MGERNWPLAVLEIVGPRLTVRGTSDAHFAGLFRAMHAGVHPVGAESVSFPPTALRGRDLEVFAERSWLQHRGEWTTNRWWLDLTVFANPEPGVPIGMQVVSAEEFVDTRVVATASWLTRAAQGRGFGTEMRRLALEFAFGSLGATGAISEAFPDNVASQRVSAKCGYVADGIEEIETAAGTVCLDRRRLTRESWRHAPRIATEVRGFETVQRLFGL